MESNRDESFRCLRLAEKYLQQGDKSKAEKFGQKATKLFPSNEAKGKKYVIFVHWKLFLTTPNFFNLLNLS